MEQMMTKNDIEKYFEEINKKLKHKNKHGEIIMAGGASLAVVFNARNSTHDIDALFRPSQEFREIISEIAEEYGLHDDWLNDGVKGFFTDKLKADLYKEYSNLFVYSIDAEGLLALKLTSARFKSKDMEDSVTLMKYLNIKSVDELYKLVEKYTSKNQQTMNSYYFTQIAFEKYMEGQEHSRKNTSVQEIAGADEASKPMSLEEWKNAIKDEKKSREETGQDGIEKDHPRWDNY